MRVHTGKATKEIVDGEDCRLRMNFADGSQLETDLIVFSAGIRPHDQLARDCGLEVAARGGIVVDYHCRTSDSRHLRDRRVRQLRQTASTAWSRPATTWRRPPPASSASTSRYSRAPT